MASCTKIPMLLYIMGKVPSTETKYISDVNIIQKGEGNDER